MSLEDGFIGYLGHPTDKSKRLSLIQDKTGIYYDATRSNELELLCLSLKQWFTPELEKRGQRLCQQLTEIGISKYNHKRNSLPQWLADQAEHSVILVVDQTAGDMSVEYGLGSTQAFTQMISDALADYPEHLVIVKTHPDVIKGKKQGYLDTTTCSDSRVRLLADDCEIKALFNKVERVYTVTSQLGFEGLLYGVPVHCYGMPFYAGWGLTIDKQICERRTQKLTLTELISAALIKYPDYLNPETSELCEVETIIDWLTLQLNIQGETVDVCYAFSFSLWKRAFIKQFVGRMAKKVVFINNQNKLKKIVSSTSNVAVLLWGANHSEWVAELKKSCPVWFIEDGFIRSIGLGADLRRPSSLVIDKQSMYYVPDKPSDIVDILNTIELTEEQNLRAHRLAQSVVERAVSKYNVGEKHLSDAALATMQTLHKLSASQQEIILVPGQFEQDQSIANSRGTIKTNLALLKQVRQDYPDSLVIYKEHPDLYSGVRPGALGEEAALAFADVYLADVDITSVLELCDRVCTLTSLTGFEALLRGKKVNTYGSPFYAGWGLTTDLLDFVERHNKLTLNQLVFATLIMYPKYVDWTTGLLTSPERVIDLLTAMRSNNTLQSRSLKSTKLSRFIRKIRYLYEAMYLK
ncbi:capsular polysaccharide biosynthesis protein [Psychromonas algicola]|uniref:capsular polysaccharide biosynthesis protein n=1 Tax=Psychromonas algicola TaxID=2555642 RepID=UPI001FBA9839|nr:capsular polysaccharide biosynthesis protein [Psychromonas sp. RZ5]